MKSVKKVALYGIFGVYNYGCEAIIRGTTKVINDLWPDAEVYYVSPRVEDDKRRLSGCNIQLIERNSKGGMTKIINKFSRKLLRKNLLCTEELNWIDDFDVVFSIGGDLYTLEGDYKEPRGKFQHNLLTFGEEVKKRGKKLVIWGCSIGPFDKHNKAKEAFLKHLNGVDFIATRESETIKYLTANNINKNVYFCADPAFTLTSSKEEKRSVNENIKIGINLSPLSVIDNFGREQLEVVKQRHIDLIEEIIKLNNTEVVLIPHVISEADYDDDYRYLESIYSELRLQYNDRLSLVEKDRGFLGTKEILKDLDVVLAARMHCAVNAMEAGVPTLLISYSKKAIGMAEYVYGSKDYVVSLKEFTYGETIKRINSLIDNRESISKYLEERMNKIRKETILVRNELNEVIENNKI